MENKNTNIDILELISNENNDSNKVNRDENDILNSFNSSIENIEEKEDLDIVDNFQTNTQEPCIGTKSEKNSFFTKIASFLVFIFKYITTSTLIFTLLLCVTNYSAYVDIARSYLSPDLLEQNKNAMLASINSKNLVTEAVSQTWEINKKLEQKIDLVQNKTYHSMEKLLNGNFDKNLNMQIDIVPYENRILIPKIWKNIPLIDVKNKSVQNVVDLNNIFMTELEKWIVRYPWSSTPWEKWNSFIFWHSSNFPWAKWDYNDALALLDNVVFWDEIIVYYNQKKYTYKIKEKNIIKPGDVSVLKRDTWKSEISIMTCWPVGTTLNRMIVVGELIE